MISNHRLRMYLFLLLYFIFFKECGSNALLIPASSALQVSEITKFAGARALHCLVGSPC